ncbi:hypothetical protein SNEBB_009334 [Seison nebaliae]|nr:hypothetical protein SNEBB_009334 [Seison nebaliae]
MSQITSNIYLGCKFDAENEKTLDEQNIKIIISILSERELEELKTNSKKYKYFNFIAFDRLCQNMMEIMRKSNKIMNKYRNFNILVHCGMGASRSVIIVASYLCSNFGLTPDEALNYIKQIRNIASPNDHFIEELERFYLEISA